MKVYQRFDMDEETPVQFVAVHPLRWRPHWGEPTDMFREVELSDVPEVAALVDAATELADLMEDVRTGDYTPDTFTTQPTRDALAPFQEAPDAD